MSISRRLAAMAGCLAAMVLTAAPAHARPAQVPPTETTTPVCTEPAPTSPPRMSVSKTTDLDPAGDSVTVTGSGYDVCRGIYVAFCVQPPPGQTPTPCGGGIDLTGTTSASQWISSYPPPYGVGLAQPYGPGGTFRVTINVSPVIGPGIDCRTVQCAVVTRADHTRLSDRTLDVIVPVRFAAGAPAATDPSPAPVTAPPTTKPLAPATSPATANPSSTVPSSGPSTTGGATSTGAVPPAISVVTLPTTTSVASPTTTTSPSSTTVAGADGGSGGGHAAVIVGGVAGVGAVGAGGTVAWRRRRARP
jgi:hypothetical protein